MEAETYQPGLFRSTVKQDMGTRYQLKQSRREFVSSSAALAVVLKTDPGYVLFKNPVLMSHGTEKSTGAFSIT